MPRIFIRLFPVLILVAAPLAGQSVPPDFPLDRANIGFGAAVATADDVVFVGEPLNRTEGVVYVYRRDAGGAWTEHQQLRAEGMQDGDRFGRALAVHGDLLLVGATSIDNSTGAAFVFRRGADGLWSQVAKLTADDGAPDEALGRSVAFAGADAVVGAAGADDTRGAVYVFGVAGGAWRQRARLAPEGLDDAAFFGLEVAAHGDWIAAGAVRQAGTGAVYVYRRDGGHWTLDTALAPDSLDDNAAFGFALALRDGHILVGAPQINRRHGAVWAWRMTDNGWAASGMVASPDEAPLQGFGSAIALADGEAWVGAPLGDNRLGGIHMYRWTDGAWVHDQSLGGVGAERGDGFGAPLAVAGATAVAGLSGDDFGEGTAIAFTRDGDAWTAGEKIFSEFPGFPPITGGEVACEDGSASIYACQAVDVVGFLPREMIGAPRGARLNDVWGWTDPETGIDYAIVGIMTHAAFVELADPQNPRFLGTLPRTEGSPGSTWRDMKVYNNHVFIVADGAGEHGMQVFDLTRLRDVAEPQTFAPDTTYHEVASSHNIVINEATGFAYAVGVSGGGETCGGGLHMIDIREPTAPRFAGCFAHEGTGRRGTGYSHDAQCVIYEGTDAEHQGKEICIGANETGLSIADVSDKATPVALSTAAYPKVGYAHQGWLTPDHRYLYTNDELDELQGLVDRTRTLIWDVSDLDDPVLVREYFHHTSSTDHNLYVNGRYLYETNNTAGLRILDVSDPENPVEVGFFDPVPWGEDAPGFDGTWSVYPFFESGLILASSRREGIFVLRFNPPTPIP